MMTAILKYGGNLLVNFIFYDFFRGQLNPRVKDKKQIFLILLICAAVLRTINSFGSSFMNLAFGPLILMVQILLLFKDSSRRELFLLLIGESIALFMELMTSLFFVRFPLFTMFRKVFHYDQAMEDFIMGIFAYLLCWIVLHGLKTYFLGARCAMQEQFPLSFFILPLATAFLYLGTFFEKEGGKWAEYSLNLGYLFLLLANILMFYTINKLFFVCEKNREQQLAEQQSALQQRYYKYLEEIDLGHRRYAHDLKNCMVSIGALAADGRNEEIVTLLGDMEVELDALSGKRYTESSILNVLLWEKSALSERYGVRMEIEAVPDPEWARIPGRDLIVMIGNLLDNAIEAAKQCQDGSVHVALDGDEDSLVVEVVNTCAEQPYTKGNAFLSTKPDIANHGFGIVNARDTVEKYGGLLYTEFKDNRFVAFFTIAKVCLTSG